MTPSTKKHIDRLERAQRRASRLVFIDCSPISSVTSMLSLLGWMPLAEIRQEHRLSILYKIINGLAAIPAVSHQHLNGGNTRISNSISFNLPICTTDTFEHSSYLQQSETGAYLPDHMVNFMTLSLKETISKCCQSCIFTQTRDNFCSVVG